MTEAEKEIVQQIHGVATATADMSAHLLLRLVNLNKLTPDEALFVLGDLSGHHRDLAIRNAAKLPGMSVVLNALADRIDTHADKLQEETGASLDRWRPKKPPA
jgi:hypothetical protein